MNLEVAKEILQAVEAQPNGVLRIRGRKMRHEAELMREAGWLELAAASGARSWLTARATAAGHQISQLLRKEAVAQRLRDAFTPFAPET
jgi:hypothetical protein